MGIEISNIPIDGMINRRILRKLIPSLDMTLWRWERDGLFPHHLKINGRNYWISTEVDEWLNWHSQERMFSSQTDVVHSHER